MHTEWLYNILVLIHNCQEFQLCAFKIDLATLKYFQKDVRFLVKTRASRKYCDIWCNISNSYKVELEHNERCATCKNGVVTND